MRFALVVDGPWLAPWHLNCLEQLRTSASLGAIVIASDPGSLGQGVKRASTRAIARTIDVASRWPDVPRVLSPDAVGLSRVAGFDFALMLGAGSPPAGVESITRHGLWRFGHEATGNQAPFFAEVRDGSDATHESLIAIGPRGEQRILEEGWLPTQKRSYAGQLGIVLPAIAEWPARACRRLAESGEDSAFQRDDRKGASPTPTGQSRSLLYPVRIASRRFSFALDRVFRHQQWNIGVLRIPVGELTKPGAYSDRDIEWFPLSGRDRFLADPFGVEREGALHVFCEEYPYRSGHGYIATFTWPSVNGRTGEAVRPSVHASYPFLIEDGGKTYCVPETSHAREVALYESLEFPNRWAKVAVLLEGFAGVDPTVFRHDGRWWLMCTELGRHVDTALHVFHATDLCGPWMPHARNPVKIDVRSARPGGPPFVHDGALYRPAQDCSRHYGWRIAVQRVKELSPTRFEEETVTILEPSPNSRYPLGRHTLSAVGDVVLIDGHRRVFVWSAFRGFMSIVARDLVSRLSGKPRAQLASEG